MSGTTNMNIVLSQGTAVKEVHNVRKQSLDLNQQYVVQHAEILRKEDKEKVPEPRLDYKVEINKDNQMKNMKDRKEGEKDCEEETPDEETEPSGDHLIDITV
ncbi:MAG: hypothetical protein EHM85_07215 [Desulfobacteraceae bacterium]|nr:MAG: hypothetical protein EHM85_07215 [Desulfobacteraceae bacterium]